VRQDVKGWTSTGSLRDWEERLDPKLTQTEENEEAATPHARVYGWPVTW